LTMRVVVLGAQEHFRKPQTNEEGAAYKSDSISSVRVWHRDPH